jgi:hypothetical protein
VHSGLTLLKFSGLWQQVMNTLLPFCGWTYALSFLCPIDILVLLYQGGYLNLECYHSAT